MKEVYTTPTTRVKIIDEQSSMLAASNQPKTGFFKEGDKYEQTDVTDGASVTASQVLAKPMFWDDSENQ